MLVKLKRIVFTSVKVGARASGLRMLRMHVLPSAAWTTSRKLFCSIGGNMMDPGTSWYLSSAPSKYAFFRVAVRVKHVLMNDSHISRSLSLGIPHGRRK